MEYYEILFYVVIVIGVLGAYAIARYGQDHYNKVLAGSVLVSGIVSLVSFDVLAEMETLTSYIPWVVILVLTVLFYLFSRIATYVTAWGLFFLIVVGVLVGLIGMEGDPTAGIIAIVAATILTIFLRKHLITVCVGLFSGYYVLLALHSIVQLAAPTTYLQQITESWSLLQIASLLLLAFAVYFQYGLREKVFRT